VLTQRGLGPLNGLLGRVRIAESRLI